MLDFSCFSLFYLICVYLLAVCLVVFDCWLLLLLCDCCCVAGYSSVCVFGLSL